MNPLEDPMYFENTTFHSKSHRCTWCHKTHKTVLLHATLDTYIPQRYGIWNKWQVYEFHQHVNPYVKDTPLKVFLNDSSNNDSNNDSNSISSNVSNNTSVELEFCDLACAKFFNDNVAKIKLDFEPYRMAYIENKLAKDPRTIYEKCKNTDFAMLTSAIYDGPLTDEAIKLRKNQYVRCLN
jgi:hypothetical protein